MKNVIELIKKRRSVRTFNGEVIDESVREDLLKFAETIENPYDIPVTFKVLDAKENGLNCPVVSGTDLYVGGKIEIVPNANIAFGYSFEKFILHCLSQGIGTVWLGGTMNRAAYEKAMELEENEMMPCATPIGYMATKMSMRENMMRKAIKADSRLNFEELFFVDSFSRPMDGSEAGVLKDVLEMVRLSPSAVNKQPWRVLVKEKIAHFYIKRTKGFSRGEKLDMQMIDMGIALCHFDLAAKEKGLEVEFSQKEPAIDKTDDLEYVASYILK